MRVIAVSTLRSFWEEPAHRRAEQPLKAWYREAKKAVWLQPSDIKTRFGTASILQNNRVVFNICGNHYRLVVEIAYSQQIVFIKFLGTHGAYDQIDAETVELS